MDLLIPAYNVKDFLPALIESARQQTTPFGEIIVYDDASGDGTADVAESLGATVIRGTANRGPAFARNRLLEAASGDLVHLHDSDDTFFHPRFVEIMSSIADPSTAAVCTWKMVGKDGQERTFTYDDVDDWTAFFINHYAHLNAVVYPRAFLIEHGGFDEDLIQCDELLMTATMAANGLDFQYTDEVYALHERRDGSLIDEVAPVEAHDWALRMCDRLLDRLSPVYHETVARKALYHTVALYQHQADDDLLHRGRSLIKRGGLRSIDSHGRVVSLISRILGVGPALQYIARNTNA